MEEREEELNRTIKTGSNQNPGYFLLFVINETYFCGEAENSGKVLNKKVRILSGGTVFKQDL